AGSIPVTRSTVKGLVTANVTGPGTPGQHAGTAHTWDNVGLTPTEGPAMTPPKRPARREFGQLDQLPSGRWRARFTGPDGRRITAPLTFATRREGTDYLARTRAELLAGNVAAVVPTTTTLEAYAAEYLRTAASDRKSVVYGESVDLG